MAATPEVSSIKPEPVPQEARASAKIENRYLALDSLRGIGALMIVIYHAKINSSLFGGTVFHNLYLFVDFFFVLSGFVIASNYQSKISSRSELVEFMRRRFWRLYPLHLLVLIAYVLLETAELLVFDGLLGGVGGNAFSGDRSIQSIVSNLLLVHSLGVHDYLTWNYPSWSISTEFYTYLLFAAATLLFGKRLGWAAVAAALAMPVVLFNVSDNGMRTTWDFGLLRCVFGFSAGVVVWNLLKAKRRARFGFGSYWMNSLAELGLVLALVLFLANANQTTAILIPFLFFVMVLVFTSDNGLVSSLLAARPFVLLGTWSYSVYMVHLFIHDIGVGFAKVLDKFGADIVIREGGHVLLGSNVPMGNLIFAIYLSITIAAAAFTYRYVEVPGRNFGRRSRKVAQGAT